MKIWAQHLADAKGLSPGHTISAGSGSVWERVRHLLYTEVTRLTHDVGLIYFVLLSYRELGMGVLWGGEARVLAAP